MVGLVPGSLWLFRCRPCYPTLLTCLPSRPSFPSFEDEDCLDCLDVLPVPQCPQMSSYSAFHPRKCCVLITAQVEAAATIGPHLLWAHQPYVRCNPRANSSPATEKPSFGPGAAQLLALCFSLVCLVIWLSAPRTWARALAPQSPSPGIWLPNTFSGSS